MLGESLSHKFYLFFLYYFLYFLFLMRKVTKKIELPKSFVILNVKNTKPGASTCEGGTFDLRRRHLRGQEPRASWKGGGGCVIVKVTGDR